MASLIATRGLGRTQFALVTVGLGLGSPVAPGVVIVDPVGITDSVTTTRILHRVIVDAIGVTDAATPGDGVDQDGSVEITIVVEHAAVATVTAPDVAVVVAAPVVDVGVAAAGVAVAVVSPLVESATLDASVDVDVRAARVVATVTSADATMAARYGTVTVRVVELEAD